MNVRGSMSIYRLKDGSWRGYVILGRLPNGKLDRRYARGQTKEAVRSALVTILERSARDELPPPKEATVADLFERWLRYGGAKWAPKTYAAREQHWRLHIQPFLGNRKLSHVTPLDLEALYANRIENGLDPQTVMHSTRPFAQRSAKVFVGNCFRGRQRTG